MGMETYNRQLLPQDATEQEIQAAIIALKRVLSYKPDLEHRLIWDLDYYRMRLKEKPARIMRTQ